MTKEEKIVELWAKVFQASNEVLRQAMHYGFEDMTKASPNIHDIVMMLSILENVMATLLTDPGLEWDSQRKLHNSKSQVSKLRVLAAAQLAGDKQVFDATLIELERQLVC